MNFIDTNIEEQINHSSIQSFGKIYRITKKSKVRYWTLGILGALVIILFIPWTQNINSRGTITTLRQEQIGRASCRERVCYPV